MKKPSVKKSFTIRFCIKIAFTMALCLLLTGCGHVKSADKLVKSAKRTHGDCEVISKSESDEESKVVLKDKLQGFEYTITSSMHDINIDGSSFGSVPGTTDTFSLSLQAFVFDEAYDELHMIMEKYNITMDNSYLDDNTFLKVSSKTSESDYINALEMIGEEIQKYNVNNRLDGYTISLSHDDEWLKKYYEKRLEENGGDYSGYEFSSAGGSQVSHIGSVRLPECKFRDIEKENEDYYLEMAQMKYKNAEYIRKEKKTFADVGIPLDRVSNAYYSPETAINNNSDPVTFYYYDANGTEFYICNFLDNETGTWYSNFDELNIKPVEEKKKLVNIHFHFGDDDD